MTTRADGSGETARDERQNQRFAKGVGGRGQKSTQIVSQSYAPLLQGDTGKRAQKKV